MRKMGARLSCSTEKMASIAAPLEYGAGDATPAEKIGRLSCTAMDLGLEELRTCDSAGCRESCGVADSLVSQMKKGLGQCGCAILFRFKLPCQGSPV